jgi:hypothetical protein
MSEKARKFVEQWVSENVQPTGYEPEGDSEESRRLAFACWRDADQSGIRRADIQEAVGELVDHMAEQVERVNDEEVQRLAANDE